MPLPDLSDERLRFYGQIGVEAAMLPGRYSVEPVRRPARPLVPVASERCEGAQRPPWDEEELKRICGRVEEFGLEPPLTISLPQATLRWLSIM